MTVADFKSSRDIDKVQFICISDRKPQIKTSNTCKRKKQGNEKRKCEIRKVG